MSIDVAVVGGGPAGSTAAGLLAKAGRNVVLFERDEFPRFHVGESLLPCDLEVLARLEVELASEGFLRKAGAEFLDERIGGHCVYEFADGLRGTPSHAFQVERGRFDALLAARAADWGADVHLGERVTQVEVGADVVAIRTTRGEVRARYLIDATGQDALLARRDKTAETLRDFGLGATFTHFDRLDTAIDAELCARGNIKIFFLPAGWCWAIPLGGRRLSVGLVTRTPGLSGDWLTQAIAESPTLTRLTRGATMSRRPSLLASFSFLNRRSFGARWVCAGDAACFLDPVFSSGVSLGMVGAAHLVDVLNPALDEAREHDASLMADHEQHMGHAYNVFATLIRSFYHSPLLHGLFFSESQDPELRRGLTSVLAGDVWRADNPFQNKLMQSKRRRVELFAGTRPGPAT